MKIIKVYNNNIVSTLTSEGREVLVTGAGIGFDKKAGQLIDANRVQKYYYFENVEKNQLHELIDSTPEIFIIIAMDIINKAKEQLKSEINDSLLIGLTDHIYNSVERFKEGFFAPNLILTETKMMYKEEYNVALWALKHINNMINVKLPEDEAGYIAIHIINAMTVSEDTNDLLCFVKDMLDIISEQMKVSYIKDSLDYYRIIVHLKFFYQRIMSQEKLNLDISKDIYDLLIEKNETIKNCLIQIETYLLSEYNYTCSQTEELYLMLHILKIKS